MSARGDAKRMNFGHDIPSPPVTGRRVLRLILLRDDERGRLFQLVGVFVVDRPNPPPIGAEARPVGSHWDPLSTKGWL